MNNYNKNKETINYILKSNKLDVNKISLEKLKNLILNISYYNDILIPSYFYDKIFNDNLIRYDLIDIYEYLIDNMNNMNNINNNKIKINLINYFYYID